MSTRNDTSRGWRIIFVWTTNVSPSIVIGQEQPTREKLYELIAQVWRNLESDVQDLSWEYLLLCETLPDTVDVGVYRSIYGQVIVERIT